MTALNVDFGALPDAIAEVERLVVEALGTPDTVRGLVVVEVALDAHHLTFAAKLGPLTAKVTVMQWGSATVVCTTEQIAARLADGLRLGAIEVAAALPPSVTGALPGPSSPLPARRASAKGGR